MQKVYLNQTKLRDSKYELLRIIAMLMIVSQHLVERGMGTSAWEALKAPFSINFVSTVLLGSWGQLGVLLFIITSSWFLVDRQGIKGKKILHLLFQIWTVCAGLVILFLIIKPEVLNLKLILKEFLTPAVKQYWFITTYLVFYLTIPILQKLVQSLSDSALLNICIVFTVLVPLYNYIFTNVGDSLADFCYIFLIIAYLKKKKDNWFERHCKLGLYGMGLIFIVLIVLKLLIPETILGKDGSNLYIKMFLSLRGRTLLMVVISICLFYYFKNIKMSYYKIINTIGSTTFGVYLIHENLLLRGDGGRSFLWDGIFHMDWWYKNSLWCSFVQVGVVVLVFSICSVIELLRKKTIERWLDNNVFINKVSKTFDNWYSNSIFNNRSSNE